MSKPNQTKNFAESASLGAKTTGGLSAQAATEQLEVLTSSALRKQWGQRTGVGLQQIWAARSRQGWFMLRISRPVREGLAEVFLEETV